MSYEFDNEFLNILNDKRLWYFPEHAFALVENVRVPLEGLRQLFCQPLQELHSSRLHTTITLYIESEFPIRIRSLIRILNILGLQDPDYMYGPGSFHQ